MIIVGQNEDVIINFDQIRGIYIADKGEDETVFKINADGGNAIFPLGEYDTEKEAKKVIAHLSNVIAVDEITMFRMPEKGSIK